MKQQIESSTKVEPFHLRLPSLFDIKPKYTIPLPTMKKAVIFETTAIKYNEGPHQKPKRVPAWRVVVLNRYDVVPERTGFYNLDDTFTDKVDVAIHLRKLAQHFSRTVRKNQSTTEYDD